jgi:aminoglycoside phosphotransferase family enzyme/predicted kinase
VTSVETHVSRLYFVGDRVYKVKKPVDYGFLDFTTLEKRRFFCAEEVRLNDRFAPDTYLGVVELRREGNRVRAGGSGPLVDYAVAMRRLPRERMLDQLIAAGNPALSREMKRLARRLAELHRDSEVCREDGADLERVHTNWRENFEQSAPLVGVTLEREALDLVRSRVEAFLARNGDLLLDRESEGHVRDGHGDLHAEQVCLTEPIRIYDCIEFNRRFRVADTVADLAFLLMDLDFRGRRDLGAGLLAAYRTAAGDDPDLELLLPFYKLYRAWVRGKVDSFLAVDPDADPGARAEATSLARRYFNLALGYLVAPQLLLTCGLMGSGKSTLAAALARATGARVLRSDVVRKELAGDRARESSEAAYGEGIYSEEFTAATYARLLDLAAGELERGRPAIVDASFARRRQRDAFARAARDAGVPCRVLWTVCPDETARQRLAKRRQEGTDPSDGRPELLETQARNFAPPAPDEDTIRVDTAAEVDYTLQLLLIGVVEG